ncbi:MAG: universal stress protein [Ilumatobacteraceae bacterium]|jgi:nucleotide-binding universal stress UspA family protein
MTLILVAVDESDESIAAAREARDLFGAEATYLAVNVAERTPTWTPVRPAWGAVYPYPFTSTYPMIESELAGAPDQAREGARQTAQDLADEAGIAGASAVGEVGEPSTAILAAAETHDADVIVIGASDKNWWHRLIDGSVSKDLTNRSSRPVLIAGQAVSARPR